MNRIRVCWRLSKLNVSPPVAVTSAGFRYPICAATNCLIQYSAPSVTVPPRSLLSHGETVPHATVVQSLKVEAPTPADSERPVDGVLHEIVPCLTGPRLTHSGGGGPCDKWTTALCSLMSTTNVVTARITNVLGKSVRAQFGPGAAGCTPRETIRTRTRLPQTSTCICTSSSAVRARTASVASPALSAVAVTAAPPFIVSSMGAPAVALRTMTVCAEAVPSRPSPRRPGSPTGTAAEL